MILSSAFQVVSREFKSVFHNKLFKPSRNHLEGLNSLLWLLFYKNQD